MESFFETKLSEKMQRTCYATKTKETCERLAAQKDQENI